MSSLSLLGRAAPMPAAGVIFGNQIRLAPFSQARGRAANPSKRCYAANPDSGNSSPALTGNGSLSLSGLLHEDDFHRPHKGFDEDFIFGGASSSFQVEGATDIGGRTPTIWDTFCERFPEKIAGGGNGEPGAGSYELYQEDVDLLHDIGLKAYRFSICWSRVLPNGKKDNPNEEGILYYKRLIKALKDKGIEPFVTLFHWEVPQALEDEYGGFLSRKIIEDFKGYAELCFERFGDDVKNWTTLNEATIFADGGYCYGVFAPGHCTPDLKDFVCPVGDSLREPYRVVHNILLSHAEAVKLYREKFQYDDDDVEKKKKKGQIGINLTTEWYEPYDNTNPLDIEAQNRAIEFNMGWVMDPLRFGKYPFSMQTLVRERLENFTDEESEKLKGSFDFIGINYYTAKYAKHMDSDYSIHKPVISKDDMFAKTENDKDGVPIGPAEVGSWINVYPKGLYKLLVYVKNRYGNPPVYITENGVVKYDKQLLGLDAQQEIRDDVYRVEYHSYHLQAIEEARLGGANVRGYFFWSLLDSFEWRDGYTGRYGLVHVDRGDKMKRNLKRSAIWLRDYLNSISRLKTVKSTDIKKELEKVKEAVPATIWDHNHRRLLKYF